MTKLMGKMMLAAALMLGLATPAFAAKIEEMAVRGRTAIVILGDIEEGDAEKFRALAIKHPKATVVLASDGGMIKPALEIGRAIRMMGYGTMVVSESTCSSSCALIWLAGSPRTAEKTAKIGFHAGYRVDGKTAVEDGMANALIGSYLGQLNLNEEAIMAATAARPSEMLWLDTSRPGAEGISYETYVSDRTKTAMAKQGTAPPPLVRTQPATPAPTDGKIYGTWVYSTLEDGAFALTTADAPKTNFLGYLCVPDKPCTYLLKLTKTCDAGDRYTLEYRVDDGERTKMALTCNKSGKSLAIEDTANFNGDIAGKSRLIIYGESESNEVFAIRFQLAGRDAGIRALEASGALERIDK